MTSVLAARLLLALAGSPTQMATDSTGLPSVRLLLGSACGTVDTVFAESFVLESTREGTAARPGGVLHLVRSPDARSEQLQRRDGRPLAARLEVDSAGVRLLSASLDGVTTQSYRLAAGTLDASLETQRLGLEETLAQLRADHAESVRALETVEALDKQRVTARVDLPRARERVATLALRVRMQEERLGALARVASRRRVLEERVTLAYTVMSFGSGTALASCGEGGWGRDAGAGSGRRGARPR